MIPSSLPVARRVTARAVIERLHDGTIVKRFKTPGAARAEVRWYLQLEHLGITPRLLSFTESALCLEACPTAEELGAEAWHPYQALLELVTRLGAESGVHHRDVHARNVVQLPGGRPGLIDWETAVHVPNVGLYDLHGPNPYIPRPDIHRARYVMYWTADHPLAMSAFWRGFEEC